MNSSIVSVTVCGRPRRFFLYQKSDDSVRDRNCPSFRDWRVPHNTAGVTQEIFFPVEGLYVHFPMPNFLVVKETFDLVVTQL